MSVLLNVVIHDQRSPVLAIARTMEFSKLPKVGDLVSVGKNYSGETIRLKVLELQRPLGIFKSLFGLQDTIRFATNVMNIAELKAYCSLHEVYPNPWRVTL